MLVALPLLFRLRLAHPLHLFPLCSLASLPSRVRLRLQESEYDTASDFDSEEDRPIVKFEWKQSFINVGSEFYTERIANAPAAVKNAARQRRQPRMQRRARGDAPTDLAEEQSESAIKHAHARKMRAAKFGASASSAASASVAAAAHTTSESEVAGAASPSALPTRRRRIPGQDAAPSLFLHIESSLRKALRKLAVSSAVSPGDSMAELAFLAELEALLVAFKTGHHRDSALCPSHFDLQPYVVSLRDGKDEQDHDTEVTSDDDLAVVDHAPHVRYSAGEEPLHLTFRNARERYLAHALVQFHQLVAESHDVPCAGSVAGQGATQRITEVRLPKAGVLLHSASLCKYLHKITKTHLKSLTR